MLRKELESKIILSLGRQWDFYWDRFLLMRDLYPNDEIPNKIIEEVKKTLENSIFRGLYIWNYTSQDGKRSMKISINPSYKKGEISEYLYTSLNPDHSPLIEILINSEKEFDLALKEIDIEEKLKTYKEVNMITTQDLIESEGFYFTLGYSEDGH